MTMRSGCMGWNSVPGEQVADAWHSAVKENTKRSEKMKKIFITGAAGYIGGSLANRLVAEGYQVRSLVRSAAQAAALAERGVMPVLGDLDDLPLLAREAALADAVINAASSDHRASIEVL